MAVTLTTVMRCSVEDNMWKVKCQLHHLMDIISGRHSYYGITVSTVCRTVNFRFSFIFANLAIAVHADWMLYLNMNNCFH